MSYTLPKSLFPFFRAYLLNFTGSVQYEIGDKVNLFDTLEMIGSGSYNTTTSTYTVPVSGLYYLNTHMNVVNDDVSSVKETEFGFLITNSAGSNYKSYYSRDDPENWSTTGVEYSMQYDVTTLLNAGDTVNVAVSYATSGYQKYIGSTGYGTVQYIGYGSTFFEGYLVSAIN